MASGTISQEIFTQWLNKAGPLLVTAQAKPQIEAYLPESYRELRNVKEAFFPAWEMLYRYQWSQRVWTVEDHDPSIEPAVLVVHPCEARSIDQVLDRVFLDTDYPDSFYRKRREAISVVVFACLKPKETCFCRMVGGGPFQKPAGALLVVPTDTGWYLETDQPDRFSLWELVEPVSDRTQSEVEKLRNEAESLLNDQALEDGVPQQLYDDFEDEAWEDISWKCLNCGACTYLCPTCYCFDLTTDGKLRGGQIRSWDACMFPRFTLHASGHNPRPGYRERVRQRVLHKFSYFPIREQGLYGCSGCGACIEVCPVNWDIREAVQRMVKKSAQASQ